MAKKIKLKLGKTQLAKVAGLDQLKAKLSGEKSKPKKAKKGAATPEVAEEKPRLIRAKSKSAFAPKEEIPKEEIPEEVLEPTTPPPSAPVEEVVEKVVEETTRPIVPAKTTEKLGPTGKHIKDILPKKKKIEPKAPPSKEKKETKPAAVGKAKKEAESEKSRKGKKVREFKDLKPSHHVRPFDARDKKGLTAGEEERWRKRRPSRGAAKPVYTEPVVRPSHLKIRLPISIKDLAVEMKLKGSELIQKLFMNGMVYTLNDFLDDETTVQYLGSELGCEITIDTSEEERIQITSESIKEEIAASDSEALKLRPPIVTFMGHVDHGKTSLIDAIRKSNIVSGEAGAITQHIGAFRCETPVGDLTVLDTPGHEAFSAMRARGAEVTDIVVLVVAGDEGIREQTKEAIQHAKAAGVTIVVAINKSDKPNFNAETIYRELSEIELLPEAWGGQTITVNTSATTGDGVNNLLDMLALQAEILEIKANPTSRARGTVLESELHKGLGNIATILIQNGTLRLGDPIVFEKFWGRVKTMHDEHGVKLNEAPPSTPVEITGLSGLPSAGDSFIVVASEKEARDIAEVRAVDLRQKALQRKAPTLESLLQQESAESKKVLKVVLRADVQGSLEALKTSLLKIDSEKADVDIIFTGVGEISESDVQLAAASNAVIIGFHTAIESHAASLIKELRVTIRQYDVIYQAIDEVIALMTGLLDKVGEEKEMGTAEVKAIFKASGIGLIAGCLVTDGMIHRNHSIRVVRDDEVIWKGNINSLKRLKEDTREVKKGLECGIVLDGFNDLKEGDILQAFEISYREQEL